MHPLEQQVLQFLQNHHLHGREMLLGFSGGCDSTALFLLLKHTGQIFRAVHFEHGIRGAEALKDAEWCRNFCSAADVPFECHSLNVPAAVCKGETLEEAARRLRLREWRKLAGPRNLPVLLAHHHDDCLENFFLRLGRGAGSSGLTGLREVRRMGSIRLYRPMLHISRHELEEYLHSQGIDSWCCDSTNQDVKFRRNAVRHELLPLWRKIFHGDENLSRTLQILSSEARYLEDVAEKLSGELRTVEDWRNIPSPLLPRVLRLWWRTQTKKDRLFNKHDIDAMQQALQDFSGRARKVMFSEGEMVLISSDGIRLLKKMPALQPRKWNWRRQPRLNLPEINCEILASAEETEDSECREYFLEADLPEELVVRPWQPGDRMKPFGCSFHKKLQDLWGEAGIPAGQRSAVPVIEEDSEIIWVPGVRRAEFGRVPAGEKAICLSLRRR